MFVCKSFISHEICNNCFVLLIYRSDIESSPGKYLLRPGERKSATCADSILQLSLAILIIISCTILLVAPTAFVTMYMLESFPEKHIPHESSILLYKLNSSPKPLHKDPTLSTSMQGDSIPFDVPDVLHGDKNHIFAQPKRNALDLKSR